MKVVINRSFGGYSLSELAYSFLNLEWDNYGFAFSDDRTNPELIKCVETLGEQANGKYADLHVVEIPNHIAWQIEEHDGKEWISEKHRIWR